MDESKKKEIQSKGGKESPANFANDREKASRAGQKGGSK
jgi:general stress protein YciG